MQKCLDGVQSLTKNSANAFMHGAALCIATAPFVFWKDVFHKKYISLSKGLPSAQFILYISAGKQAYLPAKNILGGIP